MDLARGSLHSPDPFTLHPFTSLFSLVSPHIVFSHLSQPCLQIPSVFRHFPQQYSILHLGKVSSRIVEMDHSTEISPSNGISIRCLRFRTFYVVIFPRLEPNKDQQCVSKGKLIQAILFGSVFALRARPSTTTSDVQTPTHTYT